MTRLLLMQVSKKLTVSFSLVLLIAMGVAASAPGKQKIRNLKVLPQDISDAKLDSIMQTYNIALGVKCEFCHIKGKFSTELDYALDGEPMKEEARKMMRMTININKTNFWYDTTKQVEYLSTVHCNTCHRGEAFPEH